MTLYSDIILTGTALPWWQYMYRDGNNQKGIYYQIDDGNKMSVEWLLLDGASRPVHFLVAYSTTKPGQMNYYYLSAGDGGGNSTVGAQGTGVNGGK